MSNDKITLAHPAIQGDIERARRVLTTRTHQRFIRRTLPGLGVLIAVAALGFWGGHAVADHAAGQEPSYSFESTTFNGQPELDTTAFGTDLPHCASDDYNSTHLPRCYTQRVTDGAVLIIDQSDNVMATLPLGGK